jgi:hypothetical protein
MRIGIIAGVAVLLVAVGLGIAYETGIGARQTGTTTSETSKVCSISAESTGFFLHLVSDSTGAPVTGASIKVTPVVECGSPTLDTSNEASYVTNGSGWATISDPPVSGNYYLLYSFQYGGKGYNISASWMPQQGTFTTLALPSGHQTTVYLYPKSCNGTCTY